jgi:hypothetical protein
MLRKEILFFERAIADQERSIAEFERLDAENEARQQGLQTKGKYTGRLQKAAQLQKVPAGRDMLVVHAASVGSIH